MTPKARASVLAAIERNTIPIPFAGCHVWMGYVAKHYPQIAPNGKKGPRLAAHKAAYLACNGAIPAGMVVRHTCDVATCCNPAHLVLGTTRDNIMDCVERGRHRNQNTGRSVCKNGHPLNGDNLKVEATGFRRCRECARLYQAKWRKERRT